MLKSKKFFVFLISSIALILLLGIAVLIINAIVCGKTNKEIVVAEPDSPCEAVIVLGAKVHPGGRLSDMLRDRMETAIALYHMGVTDMLLLSGDGSGEWSEVEYMKQYAIEKGVPESAIMEDPEGFSTYESLSRAKKIYGLDRLIVVTQKYHLYRAIYIAQDYGIDAKGVSADLDIYSGQLYREVREILARVKDFMICIFN